MDYYKQIFKRKSFHLFGKTETITKAEIEALENFIKLAKPQYIPRILSSLKKADLSKPKDSMRPLIEKDMAETEKILTTR